MTESTPPPPAAEPVEPLPVPIDAHLPRPRPRASAPLVVLATLAVGFTLWAAQDVILPVLLAAFFALIGNPLIRLLRRLYVPRSVAALLVVVGGIAGTVALVKVRAHAGEVAEQSVAQHIGKPVGGTKQHDPPYVAQQINEQTQHKQPRQIAHQGVVVERAFGDAIHHPTHHFGRDHGQQCHHHQQGDGDQITPPLLLEEPAQP